MMGPDRMRVLVLAGASILLLLAGTFFLGWHVGTVDLGEIAGEITLTLRSAEVCVGTKGCVAVEFSRNPQMSGLYPTFGSIVYFGSIAFVLLVAWQAGTRVVTGYANERLSKSGYGAGILLVALAAACGYLLVDEARGGNMEMTASIERGWGPIVQILGLLAGVAALYYAVDDSFASASPVIAPPVLPAAKVVSTPTPAPPTRAARSTTGSSIVPVHLKHKLRFLVVTVDLTRGGIDARREDGSHVLVMWRDVVGAVARRLPPERDGEPFVDIVSTPDSTLRLLPWTRTTGDTFDKGDGSNAGWLRGLLRLVVERCPNAKLDPATRRFLDGTDGAPAQLPDIATLAAHDNRLS